jgi:hypothetical protein
VEILWNHQESFNLNAGTPIPEFIYRINGRGNIKEGSTVHAFDFESQCSAPMGTAPPASTYLAKWKKPQYELEMVIPEIGQEKKHTTCKLEVSVREGVYVPRGQGVIEVSQGDYWAGKSAPAGPPAFQGPNPPEAISRLSISSNPPSADIEVDGEFVGSTPSSLQLTPGEHTITLRKTGYKPWQRKMHLVSGEITLNPDLEPESPK